MYITLILFHVGVLCFILTEADTRLNCIESNVSSSIQQHSQKHNFVPYQQQNVLELLKYSLF